MKRIFSIFSPSPAVRHYNSPKTLFGRGSVRPFRSFSFTMMAVFALVMAAPFLHKGAYAQGINTGNISGTVADQTGAVIPGAVVTATDTARNVSSKTTAGRDGGFSFKDLPISTYTVVISSDGFVTRTLNNIQVSSAKEQGLGVQKLLPGSAGQIVDVSAAANLLETSQSQVTTTFSSQQVSQLPLAGGFDEVALLIPGVVNTGADRFSNTNGVGFSVNGERGRANNFQIDGQSNNDTTIAGPQVFFGNEDALAEVQVITNSFSAQYGRNAGSVINYITKSGSNAWHGSAIYKYSGNFTSSLQQGTSKGTQFGFCGPGQTPDADGCAPTVVPRYVDNYYGGTLGGPIIKDKLFAFGSTYWYKFREFGALTTSQGQVFPTPAGLATLAAAFPNSTGIAYLQELSPYAVPGGNPRQVTAAANESVTSGGKTVSIPMAQFGRQIPSLISDQEDLGRLDWQATPKDHVFLRYLYQDNPVTPYQTVANGGYVDVTGVTHSVGADITHTFGPHWVDQLRYSFQQSSSGFQGGGFPTCTISSFTNCPTSINQLTLDSGDTFTSLGLNAAFPQGRVVKVGQLQDIATWSVGKHAITFGGEFDDTHAPNVFLPNSAGTYNFDTLDDFLGGGCATCTVAVAKGNPTIPLDEYDVSLFFQDDWKATPNLTLNLGLRWEFYGEPINKINSDTVAQQTGPNPNWSTALPLSQTTASRVNNYYKNFEPRLGFAYNPDFNRKLVIRGAYAINVDPQFQNIVENVAQAAPAVLAGAVNCASGSTNCFPSGPATFNTIQQQIATQLPTGGNPGLDAQSFVPSNFRFPVGQTYTLGVQYQIRNSAVFEIRYVGNHTSGQFQSINANPYLAPVAAAFPNVVNPSSLCPGSAALGGADAGFLNCGETSVGAVKNTAFSQYQSLQMNLTTQSYHGITATFAYTWSHNIDNSDEVYSNAGGSNQGGSTIAYAQNPLDINLGERANSSLDFPNVASISFLYAFPKLHTGKDWADKLVNGWSANTIWTYASGQTYTDYQGITNGSPVANTAGSGSLGQANPGDARTTNSYSDIPFENNFLGLDIARPILSNPKAPAGTLGIYTDTTTAVSATGVATYSAPVLVDYASGALVSPSQVHFIANNQLAANILGNPYPGSARHLLRGDTSNNADLSIIKDTKITGRFTFRLEVDAFDVLNRAFYGTPGNELSNYAFSGGSFFNNYSQNLASGSQNLNTPGTGTRNLLFTGKILF
ncbi:TonB-dependent receptor plug [Granulicella mallensis MP5ACTX8]|uniref:TonB-dependent receptor plug n=2 Tax=Granulicella mallensis TaxID=940614 RepID=G8P0L4_GRAMM|nr:TonB-dependent receptor plug [Granulicella mallensis MP5ACTX8]